MKSAQVKTTLGELKKMLEEYLISTVSKMEYGCKHVIEERKWLIFTKETQVPYKDHWQYWHECVQYYYPFMELRGIPEACEMLPLDTEVVVSSRVIGEMFIEKEGK